jgi:negative regulator of flagellin synthesis FlgM
LSETLVSTQKPPVDEARIKEIKQAISEGRFKINSESIANSLIESARDLVKHSKNQA